MYMIGGPLDDKRTSFLFASTQPGDDDKKKKDDKKKFFDIGKKIAEKDIEKEEKEKKD
ncbi:MAG: hypothetical protein UV18_C0009G0004 [Candidatus Magasanikbacteria bacterium GW2011_GWC2_42_27]|uniref:Uncharacterized protein n=1 Tax=Candidatus Magasanikbacteria bacterium GW2011_GWE2_42_7 TaxID=1619052 RepID=A0A0G1BGF8_9BACT|nr:MAG: hypothetical protein UV18_C0009G0004 [Candidatus Magasanikbacteria bacterium GW2011_GWC2_42_27]KKS72387.1 MAG: hypothetical protein UV42_C0009G0004 [Candidatus Magasanikbacteria bacterium GW2011_GWE2_42_7]